ncbi:RluA family pseudouridine synthase [Brevibacillus dissolubilis]|uniref:RluA family pseudouridine synthase n=1 Tax=Brevibacillus dissolubilis TaxID=1844116 RepID=UPI00111767D7|nr:RluA family pseudouridine synthase [Brevibacillus dissolubilis]
MIPMQKDGEWLVGTLTDNEAGMTYGDLLRSKWGLPKKTSHLLFQHKEIVADGEPVLQHHQTKAGQKVALRVLQPETYGVEPVISSGSELDVLYEDDHVLVVNKPAGLLVHPTGAEHKDTLDHRVAGHLKKQGIEAKVRHVHRLDQDTSGAVLYAKHALAGALLDELLRAQEIKRTYIAFVHGVVAKDSGKIDAAIGKDRHHPTRRRVSPNGEHAVTHYRVVERYKNATLVECRLETGRTHQIRVHMGYLGHPLIGDTLYGGKQVKELKAGRQALHGRELRFVHPFGGEVVTVEAGMPGDLEVLGRSVSTVTR